MMTMIKPVRAARTLALVVFAGIALTAGAQDSAETTEFSEAETRMWMTDQLRSITDPVEIRYQFEKSGSLEPGFTDDVIFTVNKVNDDGTKAAAVRFFSGERNFPVSPVARATVNPILKIYLQGDVYEMNRLTDPDGQAKERWRYFQRRIKFALAQGATVVPTEFEFDGRKFDGIEITFQPYVNDPRRNLFEEYADKSYRVVLSDDLPGYIFRIETSIPGADKDADALVRETLTLQSITPLQ